MSKEVEIPSLIEDIYDGEMLACWEDGEFVTLSFPSLTTVAFPKEVWKTVVLELEEICKKCKQGWVPK